MRKRRSMPIRRKRRSISQEFERRQEQDSGLGDLTDDILAERGELYQPPGVAQSMPGGFPPDVSRQQEIRDDTKKAGEIGTISQGASVRSTYDVRPINARDFMFTGDVLAGASDPLTLTLPLGVVPEGYVAVLRDFRFELDPIQFGGVNKDDFQFSILIDNIPVANYEAMQLGQETEDWIPMYALANERQSLSMRMFISPYDLAIGMTLNGTLHGNLLLRTGVPVEYEPGNVTVSKPIISGTNISPPIKSGGLRARAPSGIRGVPWKNMDTVLRMMIAGQDPPQNLVQQLTEEQINWVNAHYSQYIEGKS